MDDAILKKHKLSCTYETHVLDYLSGICMLLGACGHGSSSSADADSTQVNIDSLLNQAKAAVDSVQLPADSLHQQVDSGK